MNSKKAPKTKKAWAGRFVRLKRPALSKGGPEYPAGEVLKVYEYESAGLTAYRVFLCRCCGNRFGRYVLKIPPEDVELLPPDFPDPGPIFLDKETTESEKGKTA